MSDLKLNLRQNALHTLYHAVEHLYHSSQDDRQDWNGRVFDPHDHSVSWRTDEGHLCFSLHDFTRLPAVYSLKFGLLHLIQSAELLVKTYVEQVEPTAVFIRPRSKQTIGLQAALKFTIERNPTLLTPEEIALLLQGKELRNAIEHYKFEHKEAVFRGLCADFLAVCVLLAQQLLSINLVDAFSWDSLRDEPDEVSDYLASVLSHTSDTGRLSARKAGELLGFCQPIKRGLSLSQLRCPSGLSRSRCMHGLWGRGRQRFSRSTGGLRVNGSRSR